MKTSCNKLVFIVIIVFLLGCNVQAVKQETKKGLGKGPVTEQPSGTAMWCAFLRALAATDEREEVRGHDYIAEKFLSEKQLDMLRDPVKRKRSLRNPPGMYAYLMARTAYFDRIVETALRENIPQIVFLGTGYDSRPYRFKNLIKKTRIFELDTLPTLQLKKELLAKANIPVPSNVSYAPMDFNKDTFEDVLMKAGYKKDKKTLFIWEGVTYYIPPGSVNKTLKFIKSNSPSGSSVCFDFISSSTGNNWDQMNRLVELGEFMEKNFPEEPADLCKINEGELGLFLKNRGYEIIDHISAKGNDFQERFLTLRDGTTVGEVPVVFNIAYASVLP